MSIVVIGGRGGIGRAFAQQLAERYPASRVFVTTRGSAGDADRDVIGGVDVCDESSIAAAAARVSSSLSVSTKDGTGVRLLVNCAGILRTDAGAMPERAIAQLNPNTMETHMRVNAIGAALVAKHFAPLLINFGASASAASLSPPKLVNLSARVSSIEDNRLGGWISYRASKAAQNQITKTVALELKRDGVICIGIHPGTVRTALSAPFKVHPDKTVEADQAVSNMLAVIDRLQLSDTGKLFAYDGSVIPW
ncbi:hypothetical protein BC830DRAFT_249719 [Chytriomyces sp. MP71]|nr:hypothetical protein BC830DRAFT_249719 [Chytriomyces sp. MP71]